MVTDMADAQISKRPERWDRPFGREGDLRPELRRDVTDDEIREVLSIEIFGNLEPESFPGHLPLEGIFRNDTRVREYENGGVIVRQGDYGNSAFVILQGAVRVILEGLDPQRVGREKRVRRSLIRSA